MSDFSPTRTTQHPHFADRVRREIVEVHVALVAFFFVERVHLLGVFRHTEREDCHDLGLTASEEARTVDAGKESSNGFDVTKLCDFTTVWPLAVFDDRLAQEVFDNLVNRTGDLLDLGCIVGILFQ